MKITGCFPNAPTTFALCAPRFVPLFATCRMRVLAAPHHVSTWSQVIVVGMALVIGMQGVPLQELADHVLPTPCVCQERGFCPRNPDGSCECNHHNHDERAAGSESELESEEVPAQGPILQSCETSSPDAVTSLSPAKWVILSHRAPDPSSSSLSSQVDVSALLSQRMGDDVFHPPRYQGA